MPTYDVDLSDGRTVTIEGDREPTEADVMAALSEHEKQPTPQKPAPDKLDLSRYVAGGGPMAGLANLPELPNAPRVEGGESPLSQIGAAGVNLVGGAYNALKSPVGLSIAATAPAAPIIGALAGVGFGIPAIYQGLHKVYEYGAGVGNLQTGLEGAGETGMGALMAVPGAGGLLGKLRPTAAPVEPTISVPEPPPARGPLLLERGAIPLPDVPKPKTLTEIEQQFREAKSADEDARIAQLQAQKRPAQASPVVIGEQPTEAKVIPASSQSIINLARRGVMKFQFDQLQRDFEAAQAVGDGPKMGELQRQMLDLQRQLHPLEVEREQLSGQFEGEGTWPPTSEQLGTFQSKGRTIPTRFSGGPGEEALPSAEKSPSTPTEVTTEQKAPGIISGTAIEDWANGVLRGGGTHLGPDVLAAYAVKGAAVIERGVRNFAEWSKEMIKEFGEDIKPQLRNLYNQSVSLWQQSLDQPKEKAPSSGVSGKAQPSEAPVGSAVTGAATTAPSPQAIRQPNVTTPVAQASESPPSRQASNLLTRARDTVKTLWQNSDVRAAMAYTRDYADNAARLFGEAQGNDISGSLRRALGRTKNTPLDEEALSFVRESDGDKSALESMRKKVSDSEDASPQWKAKALAAINHGINNWDRLNPIADQYRQKTDAQIHTENDAGIATPSRKGYVMHAQDVPSEFGFLSSGSGDTFAGFKHIRTYPTLADSIAAGVDPKSINAVDLLKTRLSRGQQLVNRRQWVDSLRNTQDPQTKQPIITQPEVIKRGEGLPNDYRAPQGYDLEMTGGGPVAVLGSYRGLFKALTNPSAFRDSAGWNALLKSATAGKSLALVMDTFHLGRIAFWESIIKPLSFTDPKLPVPSYKKGILTLDYTPVEIRELIKHGELSEKQGNAVLEAKKDVDGLVKAGYNVGGIADALHTEWMQKVPLTGTFNRWLFHQFQRGAMAEVGQLEVGRYRRMHPEWTDQQVYREVAKDLNTRFGNLGRQGWIKSKTGQDLARMVALAPQWNEGLIRSEVGAVTGAVKGAVSSAKSGRLQFGVLPRAVGAMILGQFAANQAINLVTRGHPTWDNPEEGLGAKLSAWVPDVVGGGPGFFLHPLGLAAEISHLMETKLEKTGQFRQAILSFLGSRVSTVMRPAFTYITGKTGVGGKPIRPEDVNWETLKSAFPAPIGGSALTQAAKQLATGEKKEQFAGQYQKQIMSSMGVKTDQAPSFEQRISSLARDFNEKNGIKPSGEFYSGDYHDLTDALHRGAIKEATKLYQDLSKKKTMDQMVKHFVSYPYHPFTQSMGRESQFVNSLNQEQKQAYNKAVQERQRVAQAFFQMLGAK